MAAILGALAGSGGRSTAISVHLSNQTISKVGFKVTATATYTISSTGNVIGTPGGTLEAWLTGVGASSANYEVMATATSGAKPTGTLASWLNCGSSNSWSISNDLQNNSVISGVISVQIRDVATHTVKASASITLSAESDG